jgi:hypothetical protein
MNTYTREDLKILNIKEELKEYVNDHIKGFDYMDNFDKLSEREQDRITEDLFQDLFNTDYYIIGYYQAEQWLKEHDISIFEGIEFVQDYERDNFGNDGIRNYTNAEQLVNMITYIIGYDVINELKVELVS